MAATSGVLSTHLRTEAEARRGLAQRDAADPAWRFRHDRQVNGVTMVVDTPSLFARRTRHLRMSTGEAIESIAFKLEREKAARP